MHRPVIAARRRSYLKATGLASGRRVSPLTGSVRHKADFVLVFPVFETINANNTMLMAEFRARGVQFKDAPLFDFGDTRQSSEYKFQSELTDARILGRRKRAESTG